MKVLPDMSAVDAARGSGNGFFKLEEESHAGNLSWVGRNRWHGSRVFFRRCLDSFLALTCEKGGVSTLLGWWKIAIISCCNCNVSTVSPGKWGSAYDLPFTIGPFFFFRKRAAQFDPGAEKFPGTRRVSQLSGSTHLGWLLLWQLCLSTRGRRASVTTPTDAGWMTNQQFSVTCETVAVRVEVRSITKVLFFCCFFLSVVSQLISIRLDYFQLD